MKILKFIPIVFLFAANISLAATLGEGVNFNVDSGYDSLNRGSVSSTLRLEGQNIYIYIEDGYWDGLSVTQRNNLLGRLKNLVLEFDQVIYPRERSVFGSEWRPGVDNDSKISILLVRMVGEAGGYIRVADEYSKSQSATSNEREMIYLNALNSFDDYLKSYLAHEFQHLITFYQKTILRSVEEDLWLNEARSEYAVSLCGYDDGYIGSYLADRVDSFIDLPSDSLTEWKNKTVDYGSASLFLRYLVGRYGEQIISRMTTNGKTGIGSINQALSDLGYGETFTDVFADWSVANYLNDCSVDGGRYCYVDPELTYQRVHVDPTAVYSGFPGLSIVRSGVVKDWSAHWYKFWQGTARQSTARDTLKVEFDGVSQGGNFIVPYIVFDSNGVTTVQFMSLDGEENGVAYIPQFISQRKSVVIVPSNGFKTSNFSSNENVTSFTFSASSVVASVPVVSRVFRSGDDIVVDGENFTSIVSINFAGETIDDFSVANDNRITFYYPRFVDQADLILGNQSGENFQFNDVLDSVSIPDGSLVRSKTGYKVYIVKGKYKRWIQDAAVFNAYGHLRWEDVIEIDQSELDEYEDAWLIRAAGDEKVYEVNSDGTKHWMNMTAQEFSSSGRLWEMVYVVNGFERDFYSTGSDIYFN